MIQTMIRTYSELMRFNDYLDRFNYLKLGGKVGASTFGSHRYLNQLLYGSEEWKRLRDLIIVRDYGNDLGVDGRPISGRIVIHHMNPITIDDVRDRSEYVLDPEYLISVSVNTHKAIHYGDENLLDLPFVERTANDTKLW